MTTVILGDRLAPLADTLKGIPGPLRYLNLLDTQAGLEIVAFLSSRPDAQELVRPQLFRERSEAFRDKYIEFMGGVNARNHSLHWWAMPFTNKNPLATQLCRLTSHFLLIVELSRSSDTPLVVITDSKDLAKQVALWGRAETVRTITAFGSSLDWKRFIKEATPASLFFAFLKTWFIRYQVRQLAPSPDSTKSFTVIASLFHRQSFAQPGKYRDVYFGRLVDDLNQSQNDALVLGLFQEDWRELLRQLRDLPPELGVLPLESYLTWGALLKCGLKALLVYIRPPQVRGPIVLEGLDLSYLLRRAAREATHSGNFFMTLRVYYAAKNMSERIKISRCLYPYENRSWEKMLLLGMAGASPKVKMVGYQHASVTRGHTNLILQSAEAAVIPLPSKILTTGEVVKGWLEKEGNYPVGIFKNAGALRQSTDVPPELRSRRPQLKRVLIALATSLAEYVNTLTLLERAFADNSDYQVRVRPHPTIPLESATRIAPLTRQDFYHASAGSLSEDLEWADVVLYASSTVGLEAVYLGIPVVYLDLGDFLETDPIIGWDEFKWSVREATELIEALGCIESIPEPQFQELQRAGRSYVAKYLSPPTARYPHPFLETAA